MKDGEKREFNNLIKTVYDIYKLDCTQKSYDGWWSYLGEFPFDVIKIAFDNYLLDNEIELKQRKIKDRCQAEMNSRIITAKLLTETEVAERKVKAEDVIQDIKKFNKHSNLNKDWATRIIDNPSNYPDISLKYAKQALNITNA